MIELKDVTKRYGRRGSPVALRDVTLSVPGGAVWAVVGPNGAGKSTLLSLLLGFIRPTDGTIEIDELTPREFLRERGAGYLPERFALPARWQVRDALRLCARLDGAVSDDGAAAAERFGLGPHLDKRIGALSRGLQQRLGLAQALLAPRALVVLDEPTEGLDPIWRIRLRDIIAELSAAGRTVVLASHDLGEVERVAERAVLLEDGAVREIMDLRGDVGTERYRITLEHACDRMTTAFPAAAPESQTGWTVQVGSAAELSERLAALIELGGIVRTVEPAREPLEERVRAALEEDAR